MRVVALINIVVHLPNQSITVTQASFPTDESRFAILYERINSPNFNLEVE